MPLNRREFLKSSGAVWGAAALSQGVSSIVAQKGSVADAAETPPQYEIYALKYADPANRKLANYLYGKGWDENIQINYYVWAIKTKDEFIVVDTGIGATRARERGQKGYISPVDVLARIGANGSSVKKVIITHMHYDHIGGMEMYPNAFPNAVFYIQKREYDFWTKHPISRRGPFDRDEVGIKATADLEGTDRLVFVCGDQKIAPGIELMLCAGHTIALQSVAVHTAKGTAIVASDAFHLQRAFREDLTTTIILNMIDSLETYDKLKAKASSLDLVFGGHDVLLATDYPKVAEGVTQLV